tara:strand:+ start:322 stop:723 length:402 start_codon:yes stop_codon:yes gene_type:complete
MKYDIEFPNPFGFGVDIVDVDDHLPSLGCNIKLQLELPRGVFSYSASDVWFEYSVYDQFVADLKLLLTGEVVEAEFYDIDREILYSFTKQKISISVQRIHSEKGTGYMEFKQDNDPELIQQHISHLEKFAKWW